MILDTELLKVLPVAIYITDADGFITFYNIAAEKFWGQRPELGKTRWTGSYRLYTLDGQRLPPDEGPVAHALRTGESLRTESITERPDGSRIRTLSFPHPIHGKDGKITGAINVLTDITEHQENQAALTRIAAIVSSSDDAIVTKTLTGRVTSWNKSAARIFGYSEEEMIGQPIYKIIPPELHEEETGILAKIANGEHIHHYETTRVTKDGQKVYISLTVSPLHDKSGKVIGASKVARDVTDRKRAEEMQRLLLGELNHRVKNTLAIVQSIATQTLRRSPSPEEFTKSFSGRVQAIARAHTLFTRDSWQGTDIADLLHDQLMLDDEHDTRVSCAGPPVTLEPQAALSFSMILHELGTNARKYGALSVSDGKLSINWEVDGSRCMTLHWVERNGPLVHKPLRHGFGTTLIEKGLKAHGGEVSIDYDPEGLKCEIKLPLSENAQMSFDLLSPINGNPTHASSREDSVSLKGKRILVIEDEPLVSMDIESCLAESGSIVVGPAGSIGRAKELIEQETFDCALVDANLGGQPVDELAGALSQKNIPFVFLTGYGRESLPKAFRDFGMVGKPYTRDQLIAAAGRLVNGVVNEK